MTVLESKCCTFHVAGLDEKTSYCFACGTVHPHGHLDLRALSGKLILTVEGHHPVNFAELECDEAKMADAEKGDYCQSLLTELVANCEHDEPLYHDGRRLLIHTCQYTSQNCIASGLAFTTDLCTKAPIARDEAPPPRDARVMEGLASAARAFAPGDRMMFDLEAMRFRKLA